MNKEKKDVTGIEARLVALRLISSVIDRKTSLDGLTDGVSGNRHYLTLERRDRALCRAMVLGCLRHYGTIGIAVERLLDRPLPLKARQLHHLLYLTAAQILYLDVPDYAAIYLAVCIARLDPRLKRFAPLVNALSRQLARQRKEILTRQDPASNAPVWFVKMLEETYGLSKTQAILAMQAYEPPFDLSVKHDAPGWAARFSGHLLANGTVRLEALPQDLTMMEGFANGDWWVQDVAASLPVHLLNCLPGGIRGKHIGDLCAAPGGKTTQLALLGGKVSAFDSSKNRMQRLMVNMQRLKLTVKTHIGDIRNLVPPQAFDAVLCDAPCSSTGTCRRHPDILWTKSPNDITRLAQLQTELLTAALDFVKPGGVVVFSNCSLFPQEGEELTNSFLGMHPETKLVPIKPNEMPADFASLVTDTGFLRSTPADLAHENPRLGGMDGFFAARLIKL